MAVGSECVEMGTYVEMVGVRRVRLLAEGVEVVSRPCEEKCMETRSARLIASFTVSCMVRFFGAHVCYTSRSCSWSVFVPIGCRWLMIDGLEQPFFIIVTAVRPAEGRGVS